MTEWTVRVQAEIPRAQLAAQQDVRELYRDERVGTFRYCQRLGQLWLKRARARRGWARYELRRTE